MKGPLEHESGHETPFPMLEDRDVAVLAELAGEGDSWVAFQGLRRRLDLHQESLTRALRRLERYGLVVREPHGYRLTEQGLLAVRGRGLVAAPQPVEPIVEATLPNGLRAAAVANQLSRRWFRGLRWYGQSGGSDETILTWLTETENARVRVRIRGDRLALLTEGALGAQGYGAVRSVLSALAELYGLAAESTPGGPAGATFLDGFAA